MVVKPRISLSGWGRFNPTCSGVVRPEKLDEMRAISGPTIPRGRGRAYGDAATNRDGTVLLTERLNCFRSFDPDTGYLEVEAGVTIKEILEVFVPKGWSLPVVPGTAYASVGGCIAADVHGKNHHVAGSFGAYVRQIHLKLADGSDRISSPAQDPELFWATVGGMGLTGLILSATLQLKAIETAYIKRRHTSAANLERLISLLDDTYRDATYSVAWVDCLSTHRGRGVVMSGEDATGQECRLTEPLQIPFRASASLPMLGSWALIGRSRGALFNDFYFWAQNRRKKVSVVDYKHYFFPLDGVNNWNRFYGKKGFIQYQCVVPPDGIECLLEALFASDCICTLAVLKRLGTEGQGLLSFPKPGYTLALDFVVTDDLFSFLDTLDETVLRFDGRTNLAKDVRMKSKTFRAMYPRYSQWAHVKADIDPKGLFSSDLARRLELGGVL